MSYDGKINYLKENLDSTLADFQKKRRDNRYKAFRFKVLATLFSALATVLLGLSGLTEPETVVTKNIALGLTAAFVKGEPNCLGEASGGDCGNIGSLRVKR